MPGLHRRLMPFALCASVFLAAHEGQAQAALPAAPPGAKFLIQNDGPAPGYVTIMVEFELAPNAVIEEHSHPGVHGVYLFESGGELLTERQPSRKFGQDRRFNSAPASSTASATVRRARAASRPGRRSGTSPCCPSSRNNYG